MFRNSKGTYAECGRRRLNRTKSGLKIDQCVGVSEYMQTTSNKRSSPYGKDTV